MRLSLPSQNRSIRSWIASDESFRTKLLLASSAGVGVIVLLSALFLTFYYQERDTGHLRGPSISCCATERIGVSYAGLGARCSRCVLTSCSPAMRRVQARPSIVFRG